MSGQVMVAYATRYGSTREVAERVGARLRERGVDADVKAVRDVRSLEGVGHVVFGAPLYIGSMLKDAGAFLERHRRALEEMPVSVFLLGPLHANELDEAREQVASALGKVGWLKPVSTELFVGKYDPKALRGCDKLIPLLPVSPLKGAPASDDRDWRAIDAWADGLAEGLR
jgi:menaquinone-dependent protoporphyrinogen oxidase